ncbi:MAG: SsrA-binding protein [Candidatus Improbicoccus pseudotrichonymphae]|uniref:SsrA-binding protein n=1 Tax=Candidatus Improbicoccus pseudotrichonymphae TaxID=3033792 RepID=A0AA48IGT3_9FIRM|nr:MAG: SsrA-binding protein [Candidatus Improbicoccus pseudotrichonymphae]
MQNKNYRNVSQNKKAYHNYFVLESFEVGIVLNGTEVKSIRAGKINIKDSWCQISHGELYVNNLHVSSYSHGNIFNHDPIRIRKLLAHKNEIMKILGQIKKKGISVIPLSVYFKNSLIKLKIGLCKGKKLYDKRAEIAKKDSDLEKRRILKSFNRNNF